MKGVRYRYILLGLGLMVGGGLFALVAYLVIDYMPLAALGLAAVILGAISLGLGRTLPRVSVDAGQVLMQAGVDNVAALIEELGLRSRAVYLPTSITSGVARALIPARVNPASPAIQRHLERRFIVHFGPGPEDFGLLVATPGSAALPLLGEPGTPSTAELEGALSTVLVGGLDLVDAVRVPGGGNTLKVELVRPVLSTTPHPAYAVLGSPLASVVATVAAEVLGRPVSVASENTDSRRHIIELRLQDEVKL